MITAPSLGTVREAFARIESEMREINRKLESLHEVEAQAERLRDEMIDQAAGVLRRSDDLIEQINALPDENAPDREALLVHTRAVRRQAFDRMRELNPDQIWFWTEEWQAGEREADRQIAAGQTIYFESDEALFEYLEQIPYDANARG